MKRLTVFKAEEIEIAGMFTAINQLSIAWDGYVPDELIAERIMAVSKRGMYCQLKDENQDAGKSTNGK